LCVSVKLEKLRDKKVAADRDLQERQQTFIEPEKQSLSKSCVLFCCNTLLYRHTISDSPTLRYSQNDFQYGGRPHFNAVLFLILVTWLFSGKTLYSPCLPLDIVIVIYREDSLKSVGRRNRRLAVHDGHKSLIIGIGCPLNHSLVTLLSVTTLQGSVRTHIR